MIQKQLEDLALEKQYFQLLQHWLCVLGKMVQKNPKKKFFVVVFKRLNFKHALVFRIIKYHRFFALDRGSFFYSFVVLYVCLFVF